MPHPPRPLPPILLCALLAPFLVCSQQSSPLSFSNFDSNFVGIAGSLYVISWTGGNDTTRVVLSLSTPLNCGDNTSTIAEDLTGSTFGWTIDKSLPSGSGYRLLVWNEFQPSDRSLTPVFTIINTGSTAKLTTGCTGAAITVPSTLGSSVLSSTVEPVFSTSTMSQLSTYKDFSPTGQQYSQATDAPGKSSTKHVTLPKNKTSLALGILFSLICASLLILVATILWKRHFQPSSRFAIGRDPSYSHSPPRSAIAERFSSFLIPVDPEEGGSTDKAQHTDKSKDLPPELEGDSRWSQRYGMPTSNTPSEVELEDVTQRKVKADEEGRLPGCPSDAALLNAETRIC